VRTVLAVVCPPLAVAASGTRSDLVANLGLTALLFVPGVLHALRVVDRHDTRRRYAELLRALGPA
jgi:uncharacterized membrane protein YqaE (UPF0057 family)